MYVLLNYQLLGSESQSGKCAKLHTVAASNNRDHEPQSLLLLVRATYIWQGCQIEKKQSVAKLA